jgi:hypothetical protein
MGNGELYGVYRGMTKIGAHILKPTLFPNGQAYNDPKAPHKMRYVWRDEASVHYQEIRGFRPVSGESLDAAGLGFEGVQHLGDFIGKDAFCQRVIISTDAEIKEAFWYGGRLSDQITNSQSN